MKLHIEIGNVIFDFERKPVSERRFRGILAALVTVAYFLLINRLMAVSGFDCALPLLLVTLLTGGVCVGLFATPEQ